MLIDNWRWAGVPFYVRCGKRLGARVTEIVIQFQQPPLRMFDWQDMGDFAPNQLILSIQPNEGITLTFGAKNPRPRTQIAPVRMQFSYQEAFGSEPPEAYERLLLDCLNGDATLFTRSDEVLTAWEFTENILEAWKKSQAKNLPIYEAGTPGDRPRQMTLSIETVRCGEILRTTKNRAKARFLLLKSDSQVGARPFVL